MGRDDVWRRAIATCDGIGYGQGGHQIDPKPRGRRESGREAEGRMEGGYFRDVAVEGRGRRRLKGAALRAVVMQTVSRVGG